MSVSDGTHDGVRYDENGLVPVIAQDASTGEVLMLAYANREAVEETTKTGEAHYYSRSRGELWRKGATSGQVQTVVEMRVDCDQDAILLKVDVGGDGGCCHTGRRSCFYRVVARPAGYGAPELIVAGSERRGPA